MNERKNIGFMMLTASPQALGGEGDDAVSRHVKTCAACAAVARRLLLEEELLGQVLAAAPPPLDVDAVLARAAALAGPGRHSARSTRTSASLRRWGRWGAAALAASVAALLLIAHERSPRPGQSGPASPSTTLAAGAPASQPQKLIDPYVFADRPGHPGKLSATSFAITVRETANNLDKIARVLKQYDKVPPNVRLRFQLIEADDFQGSDPRIAAVEGALKKIFQFHGYRLAGETYVESTDQSPVQQRFQGGDIAYDLSMGVGWLSSDEIRLYGVTLSAPGTGSSFRPRSTSAPARRSCSEALRR